MPRIDLALPQCGILLMGLVLENHNIDSDGSATKYTLNIHRDLRRCCRISSHGTYL
jgi:hypothetical protein